MDDNQIGRCVQATRHTATSTCGQDLKLQKSLTREAHKAQMRTSFRDPGACAVELPFVEGGLRRAVELALVPESESILCVSLY